MRANLYLHFAAAVVASATGCQTYDVEPVGLVTLAQTTQSKRVIARQPKPDLMLLVDKSGSMASPASVTDIAGPTRWSELTAAMDTFLTASGASVRMGLLTYPSAADVCQVPSLADLASSGVALPEPAVDAEVELRAAAAQVLARLRATTPSGGTPTAQALELLATYPALLYPAREHFVLLLTDGLPNCNGALSNSTCACTAPACADPRNCLDDAEALAAIKELRARNVRTLVVGFGADLGPASAVLEAMAVEGGMARACPNGTDAECAPGTCVTATKRCSTPYYQAADGAALESAFYKIGQLLPVVDPCLYRLDVTPPDARLLTVSVDGVAAATGPETWTYDAGKVTFTGELCAKLSVSTVYAPVDVEFRIVEGL
jgi:hypothetical protein